MKNEKQLWTWTWLGGGYNSCSASSRKEALGLACEMGRKCGLNVNEASLKSVTPEEMNAIDKSWFSCFD
jgi:hypothetical protein